MRDQPNLTEPSVLMLEHKQRAIQSLRQHLADGVYIDNTALLGMLKLAFIEVSYCRTLLLFVLIDNVLGSTRGWFTI